MAKEYYSLAFEDESRAYEGKPGEASKTVVIRAEDALVSYMNETGDQPFSVVYKDGALIAFFSQEQ